MPSAQIQKQSGLLELYWWPKAIFYHIWIKSFFSSDNSGIGTFKGIEQKLLYIKNDLGCNAIWISPFFECEMKDENMHGYDVTDYYKVNNLFADGEKTNNKAEMDLENLIKSCHSNDIKIIFDFIPNHTSIKHAWFIESTANLNKKKNWYLWAKEVRQGINNFGETPWHFCKENKEYYYSYFTSDFADLNYSNKQVQKEMCNIVKYWLKKGFDGVRIDAARFLYKDLEGNADCMETHEWLTRLKQDIVNEYKSSKVMIGEVWLTNNRISFNSYFGSEKKSEFDILLDFDQGWRCVSSIKNENDNIKNYIFENVNINKCYGVFLNNHDNYYGRLGTELNGNSEKIKIAMALNIFRPVIPFIYYGTEIGMKKTSCAIKDTNLRGKFDWDLLKKQKKDKNSIFNFTKKIIEIKKVYEIEFSEGRIIKFYSNIFYAKSIPDGHVICYQVVSPKKLLLFVFNLSSRFYTRFEWKTFKKINLNNVKIVYSNNKFDLPFVSGDVLSLKYIQPFSFCFYEL